MAHLELEQLDQAEQAFEQSLEREPRRKQSIQNWMKALQEKRRALKTPREPLQKQSAERKGPNILLHDATLYRTVWIDQESGSTFIFQPEGFLQYTTENKLKGTGTWKKKGNYIIFELNGFARYTGVRRNNVMEGSAENALSRKWKWKMTQQL